MSYYHSIMDAIEAGELKRLEENKPISKQTIRKIGDRVYFRYWDGTIGTAVITNIEKQHGTVNTHGEEMDYEMYSTGPYKGIESYNCLPNNDPDVIEFIQKNGGENYMSIREELEKFMVLKGWITDERCAKGFIKDLYNLIEEK